MKEYKPEGMSGHIGRYTRAELIEAKENGAVLEATVSLCDTDHNMLVPLGCMQGIIPREEGAIGIREGTTRDIAILSRVGKPVCFTVTDFYQNASGETVARLSRKKAQLIYKDYFVNNKQPGDIIDAKVTHLENFGAFCDIGCGNVALLPIDSISVSRISHPADRFNVGDEIKVVLKQIMPDGKITVSHKELLGTWEENAERFSSRQTVSGIVRSVESYGIFVELTPNLAGLAEPFEGAKIGQTASVYIKSIIKEKMKIKLIIIDSFDSAKKPVFEYFYNDEHISRFDYSPPECDKQIFTEFV